MIAIAGSANNNYNNSNHNGNNFVKCQNKFDIVA